MKLIFSTLGLLVKKPPYLILTLVLSLFLFVFYFLLNNLPVFISTVKINPLLLWIVFTNQVSLIWGIAGPLNVLAVVAVSVLAGVNISLTILRTRATKVFIGRPNLLTIFGSFGGAFGAACSACNTSLVALLGVTGGLAIFPFQGLELSLLSLVILLTSLYFVSKSIMEWGIK